MYPATKFNAIFSVVCLLFSLPAAADVYKCKDAKGHLQYSDSPCASSASQQALGGTVQFENSEQGRLSSERARRAAETRQARDEAAKCEATISEYRRMLAEGAGPEGKKRQEGVVTAACGTNELLNRGLVQAPVPVVNMPPPIVNMPPPAPPIIFVR